jgi:UDP-glucuronate decarboxylase
VARIFNTYGPRMHPNDGRVVSNFIVQALLGRDITVYGDGSQTRAFCYVDDLVDGLIRLMKTGDEVTGPINIGNPEEFSIATLATKIIDLTGSRSRLVAPAAATGRSAPAPPGHVPRQGNAGLEPAHSAGGRIEENDRLFRGVVGGAGTAGGIGGGEELNLAELG